MSALQAQSTLGCDLNLVTRYAARLGPVVPVWHLKPPTPRDLHLKQVVGRAHVTSRSLSPVGSWSVMKYGPFITSKSFADAQDATPGLLRSRNWTGKLQDYLLGLFPFHSWRVSSDVSCLYTANFWVQLQPVRSICEVSSKRLECVVLDSTKSRKIYWYIQPSHEWRGDNKRPPFVCWSRAQSPPIKYLR